MVEGEKLVTDILRHKAEMVAYLVVDKSYEIPFAIPNVNVYTVDTETFRMLSNMVQPQGILAVCKIPHQYFSNGWNTELFSLYLDGIQDPGNLGTILRSAEWFGIKQVFIGAGTVDPFGPKTVQAGMGSHSYLQLFQAHPADFIHWPHPLILADMHGKNAYQHNWTIGGVLVLGNEGQGVSSYFDPQNPLRLTIPAATHSRSESLNVSMACTVFLTLRHKFSLEGNH